MSEKLRIGVMGCAQIAERMVIPAIQLSDGCELIAVASRTPEKAKLYGEKFGCESIVGYQILLDRNDIDVIYMPLPTGLHREWAIKSLDAGKHVLLEKSLAANYEDAVAIVEKAKEKQLLVQENFMFAYHRQFSMIENLIETGALGKIRCIRSSFGFPPFPDSDNIRYQKSLGGGALLDAGAYTLKIASLLSGPTLKVLGASLTVDRQKDVDIAGGILLQAGQGTVVETAFGFDNYYQCNLEIWGSKGKLVADRIFTAGPGITPLVRLELADNSEVMKIEPDNHFLNLLNDFYGTLLTGSFQERYEAILEQARLVQSAKDNGSIVYLN